MAGVATNSHPLPRRAPPLQVFGWSGSHVLEAWPLLKARMPSEHGRPLDFLE
jgi:hypothetical protein